MIQKLKDFSEFIEGDVLVDESTRLIYSTDASAYREKPLGVIRPKNEKDLKKVIAFANTNNTSIIPRTAGTSLAGQVVGGGIIVDVSKYMTQILELNKEEKWVRVQPGVVLDELNKYLEPHGLFFGPETSTSSRCMIGGMVGNNSCGAHSLIYGSTRDHTIEVKAILCDGSDVVFGELTKDEFKAKCKGETRENIIYRNIKEILSHPENQQEIRDQYPDKSIKRRNTGYAIDLLLETEPFTENAEKFNFCKLIAGSEGTLAFLTEIKLNLVPLPPKEQAIVCIHVNSLQDALKGNLVALKHNPGSVELMDSVILELTKDNIEQTKNRFFLQGTPAALLIVEFARDTKEEIAALVSVLEKDMRAAGYGYHFPVIYGNDMKKVWALRKAGLGLLSNMPGDRKPVPVIEDTAVSAEQLPQYIEEFQQILEKLHLDCIYYAHIATGELHLRPVLNLKDEKDVELFHTVAYEVAMLVKKYRGSLSGEHGDGRLRGEFIPLMIGENNYELLKKIKFAWDPNNIFNPGKITNTPKMNSFLRFEPGKRTRRIETIFDFSSTKGIIRAVEKCNGSGDCRKTEVIGGTMCPSYMASREEKQTTRARANILREFLTNSPKANPFDHEEIYKVMDLCLSCKACKSECPSSVDVAKLKAEFLQHYFDKHGIPIRNRAIAYISRVHKIGSKMPGVTNFFLTNIFFRKVINSFLGFSQKRHLPTLQKITLDKYVKKLKQESGKNGTVYLFNDEFTNFTETNIGIKAIALLNKLGYEVIIPRHKESGRTFISKGLIRTAQKIAGYNVENLHGLISAEKPLIGIEPSAILTFRDEYPELVVRSLKDKAIDIAANTFMIDEFIAREIEKGNITSEQFTDEKREIKLHGHCQQKSIASTAPTKKMLTLPVNYSVKEIASGCCGMAGSFGYEKEHFDLSMKIGELVLFPEIRKTPENIIVAAPGTSCRQHIKDGTNHDVLHPVEVLFGALKS
ncbi:MAG: FAD-binding protein [Bacteroidetes bacterium GWF2_38_335]|nr:MAG: FAD-binding protein [Bacteroidetes bacterium GWF2_38_335]OFY79180.1 MAG: FAD-binding protein [Bacteroidetes bacterium RIFOXYA12_FULL_38_20]HBS88801.1 FAD-binding oxidoreductase [Bacteroidales bacterium]